MVFYFLGGVFGGYVTFQWLMSTNPYTNIFFAMGLIVGGTIAGAVGAYLFIDLPLYALFGIGLKVVNQ